MSVSTVRSFRIGTVAERLGVTTRTIRYYEELGLLGGASDRCKGAHRLYGEADIVHLQQVLRMRDLLGLSLEEIVDLAQAEEARAALRDEWESDPTDSDRLRILDEAQPLLERQLALVRARQKTLAQFARDLKTTLKLVEERRAELVATPTPAR
jgi:MerR family transcriptional regulator, repressor of the yfmOP operon